VRSRIGVRPGFLVLVALVAACGSEAKSSASNASTPLNAALPPGLPPGQVQSTGDPRAALFLAKGCPQCHTISGLGVKSPNEIGPDLTNAYSDVESRFGTELDAFLAAPTGTMQMVLGQLIKLSPAERDSILHILTRLHEAQEHKP
jgi:hypothetical protein